MSSQNADNAKEAAADKADEVVDSVRENAPKIADTAKSRARSAAGSAGRKMEDAAGRLRKNANRIPGGDRTTTMAEGIADKIETAGSTARSQSDEGVGSRVASFVKNNPVRVAVAAGLVAVTGIFVKRRASDDEESPEETDIEGGQ